MSRPGRSSVSRTALSTGLATKQAMTVFDTVAPTTAANQAAGYVIGQFWKMYGGLTYVFESESGGVATWALVGGLLVAIAGHNGVPTPAYFDPCPLTGTPIGYTT